MIHAKRSLTGILVEHHKHTSEHQTVTLPIPEKVVIPMQQHMGAACVPLCKKGDAVLVGQKIGESEQAFSVPIHASCSGVVEGIIDYLTYGGTYCKAVVIATDGEQTLSPDCKKPDIASKEDFLAALKESGLVGLGGAGFPTFMKLAYKDIDRVTTLVINAAECEPYITTDNRECIENTENVVKGIRLVQKYLDIHQVYIGIEGNKPEAIRILDDAFAQDEEVQVVKLKQIYPQGAEKAIIYATTGVVVTEGKLPADCGVIVLNVSTVGFIGSYMEQGIPLISRRVTVDGDCVAKPCNVSVPIGTPIADVLRFCDIEQPENGKILMGGPMMGLPVVSVETAIVKNNNAITVLSAKACKPVKTTACIRCGRCIRTCPMKLMPAKLEHAYDTKDVSMLNELHLSLCINCGCCSFVCPAKRHLAQKNQIAKQFVRQNIKKS